MYTQQEITDWHSYAATTDNISGISMAYSATRIEHIVLEAFTSITKSNFPFQSFSHLAVM